MESSYKQDIREGGKYGSEIIEINQFSNYVYFFYVRKYFDISKGISQNEYKIDGVDIEDKNYSDIYINNDESLIYSNVKILIYTNGLKKPMIEINIPNNININENYWAAFCLNGNEGLNSLKVINQIYKNEPPMNFCESYYDMNNIISFDK